METRQRLDIVERWAAIAARTVHLAGVVWVGAFVVTGLPLQSHAALLMAGSGAVLLAMDLRARRISLREIAGMFVIVKLCLAGWMAHDPTQAAWIFWLLLIASSVTSHAPKGFRHWPTSKP